MPSSPESSAHVVRFIVCYAFGPECVDGPQPRPAPENRHREAGAPGSGAHPGECAAPQAAACQRYQFATSFNRLTKSLNEFADAYNLGTLDLKKIEEVKKAWRELEKAEARFRLQESK